MKYIIAALLLLTFYTKCFGQLNSSETSIRINKIKHSTVQIIIDDKPSGSGFFINKKGLVATNMHVIENENLKIDTLTNEILNKIEIKLNNGILKKIKVPIFFKNGEGYKIGKFYDFICLEPEDKNFETTFLKLGDYDNLKEGDNIYTCGYPFGISEPVFTTGIVSTKFQQFSADSLNHRDVAWLDLSMNKGNSGGAIIVMKENPEDDEVIGIASFNLNVLSEYAKQLKLIARNKGANANIGGLNLKGFAELTAVSIEANSYGIGGMISINYLKGVLK